MNVLNLKIITCNFKNNTFLKKKIMWKERYYIQPNKKNTRATKA